MNSEMFTWTDPVTKQQFDVSIKFTKIGGMLRFTGVGITSVDNNTITVEIYRRVPIVQLAKDALASILPKPDFKATLKGAQRGATLPDDLLEEVARIYKDALNYGVSPIEAVAKAFSISKSTSAKRVMLARANGFLGKATRGKAG
jgi:hypothetical protein